MHKEFLIIGAGPTGLGAATRLHENGEDWLLLEAEGHFGGLASSWVDPQGFLW
ncbi:MAG: protoporphyrinogen oxidase, partial [Kiritimatiellia bacterium]